MVDRSTIGSKSAWSSVEVEAFLASYQAPMRLAVMSGSGFPLICSVWFAYDGERILCATTRQSKIVECIGADPKCAFEFAPNEPPYYGVRGHGTATVSSEGSMDLLGSLVDRFLGARDTDFARWLLSRTKDEVTLSIEPHWITAWDYRDRMSS